MSCHPVDPSVDPEELDMGEGLVFRRNPRDGRFLGLTLRHVQRHLGGTASDGIDVVPVSPRIVERLAYAVGSMADAGPIPPGALVKVILATAGLRRRTG